MNKKVIDLNIGQLEIYNDRIAVITIIDRDIITKHDVEEVVRECNSNSSGNYVLLSNRIKDYSIDPIELYDVLSNEIRIKGAGIISYRESTRKLYPVEDTISDEISEHMLDLHLFNSIDEAFIWADEKLNM